MKNIDVHSHMVTEKSIGLLAGEILPAKTQGLYAVKALGKTIAPMPRGFFDLQARKSEIAGLGIEAQIVSPTHHLFGYTSSPSEAEKSARIQNDGISEVCRQEPEIFFGNATLPLQDAAASLRELDRAYSSLNMRGIEIGTNIGGKNLDDESLYPVYEKVQDLGIPIFVHPNDFLAKERFERYYMGIVVGTIAETTIAVTSTVFGGVFKKFPKLKMIFCHGGGAIPYQAGRLGRAVAVRDELSGSGVNVRKALENVYFDTVLFDNLSLEFMIDQIGARNVVFGTDYPFNMGNWTSAKMIKEDPKLDLDTKNTILVENSRALYGV